MAITSPEQAAQVAAAYAAGQQSGDMSGVQSLVNQYGVTANDVATYYPQFDIGTLDPGITLAGLSAPSNPVGGPVGGPSDGGGGPAVTTAPSSFGDNVSFSTQPMYGTAGDISAYDADQFIKANIGDLQAIKDAMARTGITQRDLERMYAGTAYTPSVISNFLGTPETMYGIGDNQVTTQQALDYIFANKDDPTLIYQAGQSIGLKPEDYLDILRGTEYADLDLINEFLGRGQQGYESRFGDILTSTFGDEASREALADIIVSAQGADPDKYSFNDLINSGQFGDMSIEDITSGLQSSQVNKIQDALTVSSLAQQYFGVDDKTASKLVDDLLGGKSDNELANKVYKELLSGNKISNETGTELLQTAAQANPDAPIFKEHPEYLAMYSPIGEATGGRLTAGQYGYLNGAPIISLDEITKQMGDGNQLSSMQDRRVFDYGNTSDDKSGWDLFTKYMGDIRTGAALHGIEGKPSEVRSVLDIGDRYQQLQDEGKVKAVTDPESGEVSYLINTGEDSEGAIKWETPASFFNTANLNDENATANGMQNFQTYQNSVDKLDEAARNLGLNPDNYKSSKDLYDAVNEKETRFMITGNTASWDPTKTGGIGGGGVDTGAGQHAKVLYQQIGDKLVPLQVMGTFDFKDPKTSGFQAQWAKYGPLISIATLPFGGPAGAMMKAGLTASQAGLAALALQTAASGGDFGDFAKSFLTQQYVMPAVSDLLNTGLGSLDLGLDASTLKDISKFGSGAIGTLMSGGNLGDYALNRGLNMLADNALSQAGIDTSTLSPTARAIVQAMLPTVISGGDVGKSLFKTAMNIGQRSIDQQNELDRRTETPI